MVALIGVAMGPWSGIGEAGQEAFRFDSVGGAAGLDAPTWAGRDDKLHLLESGGAGVAMLDFDGDGLLDLYVVNGWRLEGDRVVERGANRL